MAASALLLGPAIAPAAAETVPSPGSVVGHLSGRVTNAKGEPVPGSTVAVHSWDASTSSWSQDAVANATTDSNGDFVALDLPTGRFTAKYQGPYGGGYLGTWRGGVLVAEDAQAFEVDADHTAIDGSIQLVVGGSIRGRVTGTGGVPLARARVELSQDVAGGGGWVNTDERGEYFANGLYPGKYRLHFEGPWAESWIDTWWRNGADWSESSELEIQAGTALVEIDAQLAAPSTISGRLVNATGGKVSDLTIEAWRQGTDGEWVPSGTRRSGSGGRFTLYGLRAGTYRLHIVKDFYDDRSFINQWWDRTTDTSLARTITVAPEEDTPLGDMALLERPTASRGWTLNGRVPAVGETLFAYASSGTGDAPQATFHWAIDGTPVDGGAKGEYVVLPRDVGARVSVWVEFNGAEAEPQREDLGESEPVTQGTLDSAGVMRIEGTPAKAGSLLSAVGAEAEWTPSPERITYQWLRDGQVLAGETSDHHLVSQEDYGSLMTLRVVAEKPGYTPVEDVLGTDPICYPESAIPSLVVEGNRSVGSVLSVTGGLRATKLATTYEWWADNSRVIGATGPTIVLTKSLLGKAVVPTAVGRMDGCPAITRTLTGVVPKTALVATPRITGKTRVGATLRVSRGTWTGGTAFSYRWYANGKAISSATKSSLKVGKALRGKVLSVAVTGKKSGYATVTMTSRQSAKVR